MNALSKSNNPDFEQKHASQLFCSQGDRLFSDPRCRRWCEEDRDLCRPRLREMCGGRTDQPNCACFLGSDFYAKQQAELATAMNFPVTSISALPHCIHAPCATSAVDTGNATPCPDQVQQTCIQTIKYNASGSTYSLTGANLLAQCILSNKEGSTQKADVTQTGAPVSLFDKVKNAINGYYAEYKDPGTSASRQKAIMITAAVGVLVLFVLLSDGGGGEDDS
jgi:hypothetical protein